MAGPSRVGVTRATDGTPQIATRTPTYGALVGVARMGPIGSAFADPAVRDPIASWSDWQAVYGSYDANAQNLPVAAKAFFDEGGQFLYTSRVVHCTTPGDTSTRTSAAAGLTLATALVVASAAFLLGSVPGPFKLTPSASLNFQIDALSTAAATFTAAAASRTSGNGPFALVDGDALTGTINGQPVNIVFHTSMFVSIGAATPAEVAAAMNAYFAGLSVSPRVVASVSGSAVLLSTTWKGSGAGINITGGSANSGKLAFTTGATPGTGNVADIDAVTVAEVKTVVEGAVPGCTVTNAAGAAKVSSNTTGGTSIVQLLSSGTTASAATALGFDNANHTGGASGTQATLELVGLWDGTYANTLFARVTDPVSGLAGRFDLAIMEAGSVVESWKDCTMDSTSPSYVVTLVNSGSSTQKRSRLVSALDRGAIYAPPNNNPATGTFGPLTGGDDGLAGITDADFYGTSAGNGSATGLYVFNRIARVDLASIPGRTTPAAHAQLVTWCEVYREGRTFAVIATPLGASVADARAYVSTTAGLQELTEIAACYGPWIYIDNPSTSVFGNVKTILAPPEGAIMGMMARVDASKEGGAFEHPANALGVLRTARGVENDEYEDPVQRGLAFDTLINAIRAQRGKPIYVDGARCLKSTGPFPTVGQSRGAMLVASQLIEAFDALRNAGIRDALYVRLATAATVYLGKLAKAGCFRSKVPAEAFFVDFGPGLNTPDVAEARQVLGTVGLGAPPPAEFIFITLVPFAGLAAKFTQQVQQASPGGV